MLEQDSGIINVMLQNLGIIDAPIPWLTSPDVALIAVILVNIWLGIPFNLTLLYSGLQDIPEELYEAGALDGATGWKAFWHITWPNLRAVVSVVLMLGVIYTLKVLDIILGLTQGGPANATQTIAHAVLPTLVRRVQVRPGRGAVQHLDPDLTGIRGRLPARHPAPGGRVRRRRCLFARSRTRSGIRTAIAIVLLAIMLFPVYWMLNISLQSTGGTLATLVLPDPPQPRRLPDGDPRPGPQPGHQPDHRRRHRGADPADRHALRVRAGPVPVPLDQLGAAGDPDLPDDPGDRDRQRALQRLRAASACSTPSPA